MANDLQRERVNEEAGQHEEDDPFFAEHNYLPYEDDASDVENYLIIECTILFTSLEGTKRLYSLGLAFVGTIRSNKKCISIEMRKNPS